MRKLKVILEHSLSQRFNYICLGGLAILIGLITGCGSVGNEAELLEKAKTAPRFRIGMLTIQEPKLYEAKIIQYRIPNPTVTLPGRVASIGMISAYKGLDTLASNYNLTEMLREKDFSISHSLAVQIKKELKGVGYEVVDTPVEDHRHASDFRGGFCLNAPPMSEPCANYFLHVVVDFVGYTAFTQGQPFVPMLQLRVQLISVTGDDDLSAISEESLSAELDRSFKLIYAATFTYGGLVPVEGPTDVPFSPKFALRGRNDLDNSNRIIAGLDEAAKKLAKQISLNLR